MTDDVVNKNLFSKKHRPFGVWVLTIHAVVIAWFVSLIDSSVMVLKGEVAMFSSDDIPSMLLMAYLIIGVIIASILTWIGWEPGRIFFLVLTSIFYLWLGINRFSWIINPNFWEIHPSVIDNRIVSVFQFIGCILTPIIYIWYLNKPSTRAFYRKVKKVS